MSLDELQSGIARAAIEAGVNKNNPSLPVATVTDFTTNYLEIRENTILSRVELVIKDQHLQVPNDRRAMVKKTNFISMREAQAQVLPKHMFYRGGLSFPNDLPVFAEVTTERFLKKALDDLLLVCEKSTVSAKYFFKNLGQYTTEAFSSPDN